MAVEVDEIVLAFGGGPGIAAMITAIAGFVTASITAVVSLRKMREVGADAKSAAADAQIAAHQVQNNSGQSLKDTADRTEQLVADVKELMAKDSEMIRSQGHQLGEIRDDLMAERHERQASDKRHHDEHQRLWTAIGPH